MVVGSEDGGGGAGVGGKPGLEHHASLDILEGGDALFELHVDAHGAGDGADGAGANAEILHRLDGGFPQLGMGGQPQVVIGGEVDDLFAVEARFRGALRFQDAQALIGAFRAPLFELIMKVRERLTHTTYSLTAGG